jgi:hypothetical protein
MRKLSREAKEFFDNVWIGYEPSFVSGETTIWDVSMSPGDELLKTCSKYYGKHLWRRT